MQILSKKSLTLGGFAGLTEHRFVTDQRVFGPHKAANTFDGIGNFVYLADAQFNPEGQTGMHPHKEIDVISVMISGQVSHEGSLEHGKALNVGDVQVQRAGGEGFSHNEINPDKSKNRMIQLWVLPETAGEPAGYKYYTPTCSGTTRVYGGDQQQNDTFASATTINIVRIPANSSVTLTDESLAYITKGTVIFVEQSVEQAAQDGDLIRSNNATITAGCDAELIVISH